MGREALCWNSLAGVEQSSMTDCKGLGSVNARAENSREAVCLYSERVHALSVVSGSICIDYVTAGCTFCLAVVYHPACFYHILLLLNLLLGFILDLG